MTSNSITTRPGLGYALLLTAGMAMVVGSALGFEHIGGYIPCALCLLQRNPYYIGIGIGALTILASLAKLPDRVVQALLILIAIIMVVSAGLGVYHAGVEWKFWEGPTSCSVGGAAGMSGAGNILDQLNSVKGPSCTEATLRVLGLSFAGWNVLTSIALAALAFLGASKTRR